ncbi:uncharacterized protein (TIGR03663 family) [Haloferula luteola]|uniref:Uncharacterized protein (TIGR03663 family) n=1 Tax=Haloferula luteola TaxID=595692 RepID=A0A840UZ36_9BACT|nr:glycosyltransferase family 39 protein [Haloferula luteola]MBB5351005.1 uncharacterized protein (TIGR03663 family) [Haloferula luteola]
MNRYTVFWLLILSLAGWLRFHDLDNRPVHADEATGARIVARALDGDYRFDPVHYHGPVFHRLGQWTSSLAGHHRWQEMEMLPLRQLTALAGLLTVALPLLGVRRFGQAPMLVSSLLLATSPLLVYYSRMFIHESLLALFGGLVLVQLASGRAYGAIGFWLGLMYATKETFVLTLAGWGIAAVLLWGLLGKSRPPVRDLFQKHRGDFMIGIVSFLAISLAFYTDGFRHWQGAIDAVRTYFIYDTTEGHDKAAWWYLDFLAWPLKSGGLWWWTGAPLILAILAAWKCRTRTVRFLALAILAQLAVYSAIAYKTPWLMVLPWAQVLLLAGFSLRIVPPGNSWRWGAACVLTTLVSWQTLQSWRSSFVYPSEARNRFAYVPTSPDMENLNGWLDQLAAAYPELPLSPIGIIGHGYWPLPWYLRQRGPVGHWDHPPASLARLPLVFSMVDLTAELAETHVPIPRGLRDGNPVMVWVRNDFWDASVAQPHP